MTPGPMAPTRSTRFGSALISVCPLLAAQQDWRRQMEAQPTRLFSRVFPGAVREAAAALGAFVGAKGEDIAFVTNATEGCNAGRTCHMQSVAAVWSAAVRRAGDRTG